MDTSRFEGHTPGAMEITQAATGRFQVWPRETKSVRALFDFYTDAEMFAAAPRLLEERNRLLEAAKDLLTPGSDAGDAWHELREAIAFAEEDA